MRKGKRVRVLEMELQRSVKKKGLAIVLLAIPLDSCE